VCSDQLVCQDLWSVARTPPTSWWPVVTATLVILPEVATTDMPLVGLAFLVPLAGVMVTWAEGEADGAPAAAPAWPAALEPAGLVQAAANRETIPNTAMMPSAIRRLDGRLR
jgi:hypothetical protein